MKPIARSTLVLVTHTRLARVDFDGGPSLYQTAPRGAGVSATEAVRLALALGGKAALVWVLSEDVFEHQITLGAAQVAGLSNEQLGRALSFEVEPFSGIPVSEGVTGFHRGGNGVFDVIELARADLDLIHRAVTAVGGKLAGVAYPGIAPGVESLETWLAAWLPRLQEGALPVITLPPPAPSKNRFLVGGIGLVAASLLLMGVLIGWTAWQRRELDSRFADLEAARTDLESANKNVVALKKELSTLEKERDQREHLAARRGALSALLEGMSVTRGEDVVVRSIAAEGPSTLVIGGLSLEAGAVDEMSIVLTQKLRGAGWTAQPRSKTGLRRLPSGGPWDFSLTVSHNEDGSAGAQPVQLSQRRVK